MSKSLTTKLQPATVTLREYSSPFSLLPPNEVAPEITSQPLNNLNQTTWIEKYENAKPIFQTIQPQQNRLTMLQGTAFSLQLQATDPSNLDPINKRDRLSYKWKRDDALLTRFSKGSGSVKFTITQAECVPTVSGIYHCEVSNNFGTTSTENINLTVIDPDNHPKLYKNLINNGDGSGGIDSWEVEGDIRTEAFQEHLVFAKNFASFRLGGLITFKKDTQEANNMPPEFRFSNGSHYGLFFPFFLKRSQKDNTFLNINVKSSTSNVLNDEESYISEGILPQIVANEDYGVPNAKVAGFFPGPLWMDRYNKNTNPNEINLSTEIHRKNLTYFTRDKLKFTNVGGNSVASLSQTVDVSDLADMVDGNAYGIRYLTSQFFAYIGTGITGYQVKAQVSKNPTGPFLEKIFNYYVGDSEEYARLFAFREGYNIAETYAEGPNGPFISYKDLADQFNPETLTQKTLKASAAALQVEKTRLENAKQNLVALKAAIPSYVVAIMDLKEGRRKETNQLIVKAVVLGAVLGPIIFWLIPLIPTLSILTIAAQAIIGVPGIAAILAPISRLIDFNKRIKELENKKNETEKAIALQPTLEQYDQLINQTSTDLNNVKKKQWLLDVEQRAFYTAQIERSHFLKDNSSIEITPITADTTEVVLDFIDRSGVVLKKESIKGPSSLDVWAIKEKVFFPLTLYPLYTFLRPSSFNANVTIKVFGQKYTTTNVLRPFFTRQEVGRGVGLLSKGLNSLDQNGVFTTINEFEDKSPIQDKNARFLLNKYDFTKWGAAYPPNNGDYSMPGTAREFTAQNAVNDHGAAAMFGVSRNIVVPPRTRSIRVNVIFRHNSIILEDPSPAIKGWQDSEAYNNDYGQNSGTSRRLSEYGNPRCGITSIKLLLAVNDMKIDDKHVTYNMPPQSSTVLGMMYKRYGDPNAYNTADIADFSYKLYQPQNLQEPPITTSPFQINPAPTAPPSGTGPSKGSQPTLTPII